MSNEHLLLIECCKQVFLGGRSEFIKKLITDGINYNYLLQLSLVNRVSPTVYEVLINKNQLSSYFPRDFISELQKRFYITQEENRIKQTALFEILEESNRRKLKPVGIKGASITVTLSNTSLGNLIASLGVVKIVPLYKRISCKSDRL